MSVQELALQLQGLNSEERQARVAAEVERRRHLSASELQEENEQLRSQVQPVSITEVRARGCPRLPSPAAAASTAAAAAVVVL